MADDKPIHITFRAQSVPMIDQDPAVTTTDVTVHLSRPDAKRLQADLTAALALAAETARENREGTDG